jgi:hypothetical protein
MENPKVRVINTNSSHPEIADLPAEEKIIFFGRLREKAYCAITIAKTQEEVLKNSPVSFGETEGIQTKIYYFENSILDCRPITCGAKITDRWFCRTEEKNVASGYDQFNLCFHDGAHYFNNIKFEKIFQTL